MATSRIAESVGRVLGDRYRLTRPLGVGASAHVYAAEDVELRRRVAVKLLHPALAGEEAFLRRFRAEARAVAALRHPNILRIYDWGDDGGAPYLVMELLEGGSLRSILDGGGRLSPGQAAKVGADAARALDYAHRQGIVHRDVKPANLVFDDEGRVSVADFGLARALAEATWTEPVGSVIGTARYAAPELVRGQRLDDRADVYSLALVLVEAVTGTVPFVADTAFGTLMARADKPIPVPDGVGQLKPVLEAAGAAEPGDRLSAGELAKALDAVGAKMPLPAPLPLAGPMLTGLVERDAQSPTEMPGKPRLFDGDEVAGADPTVAVPAVNGAAPADGKTVAANGAAAANGYNAAGELAADATLATDATEAPKRWWKRKLKDAAKAEEPLPSPPAERRRRWLIWTGAAVAVLLLATGGGVLWAVESGKFTPSHPVPSVVGISEAAATSRLTPLHLHLQVAGSQYSATVPKGDVISQTPRTGKLKEGSTVRISLSSGPQPVPVPKVANDDEQAAEQAIKALGLKVKVAKKETSMTVPSGAVISSSPDSGTLLPGQTVNLVVSKGKPQVTIPSPSSGENAAAYAARVNAMHLTTSESVEYNNTVPKGDVIYVSPAPGDSITIGSNVSIAVSQGPHMVAIPNVAGMSVGQAAQAISAAGLSVSGVQGNPIGTVARTSPAAKTQVLYGSAVTLVTGTPAAKSAAKPPAKH